MENKELEKYRQSRLDTKDRLSHKYDKLLVALSSGALVLSIALLKDVIVQRSADYLGFLAISWGAFSFTLFCVLLHIKLGIHAQEKAANQVDENKIYNEKPGGGYSKWTFCLSIVVLLSFSIGLIFITTFAILNILKITGT